MFLTRLVMTARGLATVLGAMAFAATFTAGQEVAATAGKVRKVTLYRGQALITREVEVAADRQGVMEITVGGLPSAVDPKSVFADEARGLEIRSVTARAKKATGNEAEGDVAKLDDEIRERRHVIATKRNEVALRRLRQDYLRGLQEFTTPATQGDLSVSEHVDLTHSRASTFDPPGKRLGASIGIFIG